MIELLSTTDSLSKALQRKDQDIVHGCERSLAGYLGNGWDPLFKWVKLLCDKNEIKCPT